VARGLVSSSSAELTAGSKKKDAAAAEAADGRGTLRWFSFLVVFVHDRHVVGVDGHVFGRASDWANLDCVVLMVVYTSLARMGSSSSFSWNMRS
jgi:hypothetical protein